METLLLLILDAAAYASRDRGWCHECGGILDEFLGLCPVCDGDSDG